MNNRIIPMKSKRRQCVACDYKFTVIHQHHRLCATCYRYHRVGQYLELSAQLLKGLGK